MFEAQTRCLLFLTCKNIWLTCKTYTTDKHFCESPCNIVGPLSDDNLIVYILNNTSISIFFCKFLQIFGRLVLGCIKTNFCKKIRVCVCAQHFFFRAKFQALKDLHTFAPLQSQIFSKKSVWKISNFCENSAKFCKCCKILYHISKIAAR